MYNAKDYIIAYFLLESILFAVFSCLDVMLFYLLFEAVLIPMFLIVGFYGSRGRKVRSAYMLFLYTLIGSVLMLLAILLIYAIAGTTDYQILLTVDFDETLQKVLWIAFFASFAVICSFATGNAIQSFTVSDQIYSEFSNIVGNNHFLTLKHQIWTGFQVSLLQFFNGKQF